MAFLIRDSIARSVPRSAYNARGVTAATPRLFSSSTAAFAPEPESPQYIDVPRSIQPDVIRTPQKKGTLPVPRELFPPRRPDKPGSAYLKAVTPEPTSEKAKKVDPAHPDHGLLEWKAKMATLRRRNLRQGLVELYIRKRKAELKIARKSEAKQERRRQIISQPERADEYYTRPTTVEAMTIKKQGRLPTSGSQENYEAAKAHVEAREAAKKEDRQDSLHTLYMNARSFITTEEQLMETIDRVFPVDGHSPDWDADFAHASNMWDLGPPSAVDDMLKSKTHPQISWRKEQSRIHQLAEAITGGKI